MSIAHWPKEDRPREKLRAKGELALTEAELIAILIKTGIPGKTALDISKELLVEYGGLKKLLNAPVTDLIQKPGLGEAKYAVLRAAVELGRRYLNEAMVVGEVLDNSIRTRKFVAERLRHHRNEVFACLFMDNHFRFISFEELFHGTVNAAQVYPREILKRALEHNACKLILAHNHPSGLAAPSDADKEITQIIRQALAWVDVDVVDHIIIGNAHHFSFADAGLLQDILLL